MKAISRLDIVFLFALTSILAPSLHAKIITVNTTNQVAGAGQTNLFAAISLLADGDTIQFNISGAEAHYVGTPAGGYPLITNNSVTIDGYSQPGAVPNTNSILAANNAQIKIVLDSRNGNYTDMGYEPTNPDAAYPPGYGAILGIFRATNVTLRGLCFLGTAPAVINNSSIAVARDYSEGAAGLGDGLHVSGCWIGLDVDGTPGFGAGNGVVAERHEDGTIGNAARLPSNGHIIGVKPGSANPRAEFNVIVGSTINLLLLGQRHRVSGNFLGVLPNGTNDYILPFAEPGRFAESHIEIGRGASDVVIGTDGDGVNDADERNIMGGVVTDSNRGAFNLGGYRHVIEIFGLSSSPGPDRQNIKIAGNYIGVGIDGATRFTNGVPAMNGSAATDSQYWVGSDFDGVSDAVEPNVIFNNYPPGLYYETAYTNSATSGSGSHGFFDEPSSGALYSVRGNVTVNNYPFPVNPGRDNGSFITNYVNKALIEPTDTFTNLLPILSTSSTTARLIGTAPANNTNFPWLIFDLYLPDPEGLTNGLVVPDENLPNGWVQGLRYLGSFVDNGVLDLNTNAGAFEFDTSSLGLAANTAVTLSANYSKDPPGTHNGRTMTALFSYPVALQPFIPGGVASVGVTNIVQDVLLWYNSAGNYYTNGPVDPALQVLNLANWEPYISVLGDSTFLIEANTFADDGAQLNQRYAVMFQPANGGAAKLGEAFFTDTNTPFRGQINISRQNGNPGRVAGDMRPGAVNFITGGEASPHGLGEFLSNSRWTSNGMYTADNRYSIVQTFSLDTSTLVQTPLAKAFDAINGRYTSAFSGNIPEVSRFGGGLAALDNGNFVVVVDDRSSLTAEQRSATAVIISPTGDVIKETFLVDPRDIWDNVAAHQGGFAVRAHEKIYFYDNAGDLQGTENDIRTPSGLPGLEIGRADGSRIAGHINSPFVYLADQVNETDPAGNPMRVVYLLVWDSRTRAFVNQTKVSVGYPQQGEERANLAVDALDRVCVAYEVRPTPDFVANEEQIAARVVQFIPSTGTFTFLTGEFFPFVNHVEVGGSGLRTLRPSVAMTTSAICIAGKGTVNSTNNPAGGPNTAAETTLYTVINHPDPQPPGGAPIVITNITTVGSVVTISWTGGTGPYLLQMKSSLTDLTWQNVLTTPRQSESVALQGGAAFFRVADNATNTVTPFTAFLSGLGERPLMITNNATGLGSFSLEGNTLIYYITFSGLSGPATAAHIHGPTNTTGSIGVIIPFSVPAATSGTISGSVVVTDQQKSYLLSGLTYANIHTSLNGGGEIRGQIGPTQLQAALNGANERPTPVVTQGAGTGTLTRIGNQLLFDITYSGLSSSATAAHIHGPVDTAGFAGVLLPLPTPSGTSGTISGSLPLDNATLSAIVDGLSYVNIHTQDNGGGEIRGQITP